MEMPNKPLPTKFKMIVSTSLMMGILFAFNQCVVKQTRSSRSKLSSSSTAVPAPTGDAVDTDLPKNLPPGVDMPPMNSPVPEDLNSIEVGVKNFEQINSTMSALTGVPVTNSAVVSVYNDISIQLPSSNNVKNFLPSMQVAITKLATEYCDQTVETDAYRIAIWTSINFSQTPTQTLTATNKATMINQTVSRFLGPVDQATIDQTKTELLSLYDTLIAGESLTSNLTTKKVVKGICVATLSSAYVTLL